MTKDKKRIFARKVAQLKPLSTMQLANVTGSRLNGSWSCCGGDDGCRYQPDDSDEV